MALLIQNIPKGARVCITMADDLKDVIYNEIVTQEFLEFETEKSDNGKDIKISMVCTGYLPYSIIEKIRPRKRILLDPKVDLLHKRDGI